MDSPVLRMESAACAVCGSQSSDEIGSGVDYDYETSAERFHAHRCRDCGHVYLNPRPAMECAGAIYPKTYYTLTGAHQGGQSLLGRIKDRVLLGRIRPLVASLPEGARILEVGCGDCSLLLALRRWRKDLRLTGIDYQISEELKSLLASNDIVCIEDYFEHARSDERCDVIIMNQIIEHVWDVRSCLEKARDLLRPGGAISIATPNVGGYDHRLFRRGAWGGYYFPRHLNLFSAPLLQRMLEAHGFGSCVRSNLVAPLIWMGTARALAKRCGLRMNWLFKDSNLPLLAAFTAVDVVMKSFGFTTSNQQLVARKSG